MGKDSKIFFHKLLSITSLIINSKNSFSPKMDIDSSGSESSIFDNLISIQPKNSFSPKMDIDSSGSESSIFDNLISIQPYCK